MVNIRPEVDAYDLKLKMGIDKDRNVTFDGENIPPFGERGFYLTGEEPAFYIKVRNNGGRKVKGILVLTWHHGMIYRTVRPIGISLEPGEVAQYPIRKEWLVSPQISDYRLQMVDSPENVLNEFNLVGEFEEGDLSEKVKSSGKYEVPTGNVHTLSSFGVKEKSTFEQEQSFHKNRKDHQKWMVILTAMIAILTAVYVSAIILRYTIGQSSF